MRQALLLSLCLNTFLWSAHGAEDSNLPVVSDNLKLSKARAGRSALRHGKTRDVAASIAQDLRMARAIDSDTEAGPGLEAQDGERELWADEYYPPYYPYYDDEAQPSHSPTHSRTPTHSHTASRTHTATSTHTPARTHSHTATRSGTASHTASKTGTASHTASKTGTPSHTASKTGTPSHTTSQTSTNTPSPSRTTTPTNTGTPSGTPTPTNTGSMTPSLTFKGTATAQCQCPSQDTAGFPLGDNSLSNNVLFCSYPAFQGENPNDFYCTYNAQTGALVTDHDAGFCPGTATCGGGGG